MKKLIVLGLLTTAACAAPSGQGGSSSAARKANAAPIAQAPKSGTVTVVQTITTVDGTPIPTYTATASFVDAKGASGDGSDGPCVHQVIGDCKVDKCDVPQLATGGSDTASSGSASKLVSAGKITVAAQEKLTLLPDAAGRYARASKQAQLFDVGGPIAIKAEGGDVPAFAHTISGPAEVSVTAPAWPSNGAPLVIDRAKDLAFSWTGGSKGSVGVSIGTLTPRHTAQVSCNFDAATGKATISAATLAVLSPTSSGSISIDSHKMDAATQSGWYLTINASRPARAGDALAVGRTVIH